MATHLEARGLSLRGFGAQVGLSSSYLSKVIHWKRALPRSRLAGWAKALALGDRGRAELEELVLLGHCPPEARAVLIELRRRADWPGMRADLSNRRDGRP